MGACLSICRKAPPDDTTAKLNGAVAKTEEAAAPAPENTGVENQAFEDEKGKGLLVFHALSLHIGLCFTVSYHLEVRPLCWVREEEKRVD